MRRFPGILFGFATLTAIGAAEVRAQGTPVVQGTPSGVAPVTSVSGQVAILERPGETSEDLENVVVYLEPLGSAPRAGLPAPTNTVITLEKRQFSPRVRVVTEGSRIEFPNEDAFNHNVFSKANGGFDTQTYGRGKRRDHIFGLPGVYPLYCNVHPRMTAFVITLRTPHYTQGGKDGRFTIEAVPPGRYRLHVWHDRTAELVEDLVVPANGVRTLRKELDARGYKYVQHKNKLGQVYTSGGDRY